MKEYPAMLSSFCLCCQSRTRRKRNPCASMCVGIIKQFSKDGETPPDEWFGEQAVFRLSLGNFVR